MRAPYDSVRHLEEILDELSPDERHHFMAKAEGAEYGELAWFFEGRTSELSTMAAWLRTARSGMLVVHGRAGSGKSALLGNIMVQSLPDLCDALARRGLATALEPDEVPPARVFDAILHLAGLTMPQIIARIAAAAGLAEPPSHADPARGIATDLDWLAVQLAGFHAQGRAFTVLADALDESTDPLDTGRSLLARIAAIPGVRVVVGTRVSSREVFDVPPPDTDLLDALSTPPSATSEPGEEREPVGGTTLVVVERDPDAIRRYVRRRLRAAQQFGRGGESVLYLQDVTAADIERVADDIADRRREFLYARLAVYELIEDALLLTLARRPRRPPVGPVHAAGS
jgi:hypothetical protein